MTIPMMEPVDILEVGDEGDVGARGSCLHEYMNWAFMQLKFPSSLAAIHDDPQYPQLQCWPEIHSSFVSEPQASAAHAYVN
eukprot:CAMPEP_0184663568 /NCGR_PEP_ID=MMETSP0308-20130426/48689_1 /TAXON_ID=38269 /ORGANISM="Gloeochaete witrockiana, Strain SAG 46.84" /LENGTH=80 /DNA_ID=CAMNT_0027106379 /DNA_START=459 /DNA_END=701 /DNA_ORIENTATION=-